MPATIARMCPDHGLHLPVDTDVVIVETICRRAAELAPDEMALLPCVSFGYSPHHIDGPGVLTIKWDTFINYVKDISDSLAYHGFRHILIVNGHGSNRPCLDLAARLTIVDNPDVAYGQFHERDKGVGAGHALDCAVGGAYRSERRKGVGHADRHRSTGDYPRRAGRRGPRLGAPR